MICKNKDEMEALHCKIIALWGGREGHITDFISLGPSNLKRRISRVAGIAHYSSSLSLFLSLSLSPLFCVVSLVDYNYVGCGSIGFAFRARPFTSVWSSLFSLFTTCRA